MEYTTYEDDLKVDSFLKTMLEEVFENEPMRTIRITLAQINSTVGDLSGNLRKICDAIDQAKEKKVDLIAFPEMAITGYPPEDLILKQYFINDNLKALRKIVQRSSGIAVVVGFIDSSRQNRQTEKPYNAAAVICEKKIKYIYHKCHLPNYGVFDEARYFQPGQSAPVFVLNGTVMGINICEDIWNPNGPTRTQTIQGGAEIIINISASPYRIGVSDLREKMLATCAKDHRTIIAYLNMVGGQDELVFDGESLIVDEKGVLLARAPAFKEFLLLADLSLDPVKRARLHDPRWSQHRQELFHPKIQSDLLANTKETTTQRLIPVRSKKYAQNEEIYQALMLGLSDYVQKNRFKKVVVALSGGIDSALTAVIAVDALGSDRVTGVFMPSRYTSKESSEDVEKISKNIGINLISVPIEPVVHAYTSSLEEIFLGYPTDTTEENLQSRIRGNIIMALSNKLGWLVLTTGNKSEMAVGYATLYGDMAGGFAVIKDIWKTVVYPLARYRNKKGNVIPTRILTRPPTAELRPNQKDCDTLPPYTLLDPILKAYIENDASLVEMVEMGFDREMVAKVIALVDNSEFKRRQAPLGVKITLKGLGKDRRMPITNHYCDKG